MTQIVDLEKSKICVIKSKFMAQSSINSFLDHWSSATCPVTKLHTCNIVFSSNVQLTSHTRMSKLDIGHSDLHNHRVSLNATMTSVQLCSCERYDNSFSHQAECPANFTPPNVQIGHWTFRFTQSQSVSECHHDQCPAMFLRVV